MPSPLRGVHALGSWASLCAALGFAITAVLAPSAWAARPSALTAEDVSTEGYRWLFSSEEPAGRTGARFTRWAQELRLDALESLELTLRFELKVTRPNADAALPSELPVVVIDRSLGDWCEGIGVEVAERPSPPGFGHLGDPVACAITLPETVRRRGGSVVGEVIARRPRVERVDDRYAFALPLQPLVHPAALATLSVVYSTEAVPRLRPLGWSAELSRLVLDADRERRELTLADVNALPLGAGVVTVVGRAPTLLVDSGESWDELAALHAVYYENAARAEGAVIPLAGAVLAQPDTASAALEAVIRALDGTKLDPSGGRGGAYRLPARAVEVVEAGTGTVADRAALLIALLRTADVRAEVLLLSSAPVPLGPDLPMPLLNQTLVVVPKGSPDGSDLYVDPARGSLWLGGLPSELLGRDALLLSRAGSRWVRTPDDPPARSWTLNASERSDGDFDVTVRGELSGDPAARLREWLVAGRPAGGRPDAELAWLGAAFVDLETRLHSPDGARLVVRASGVVPRARALPSGRLAAPEVPAAAPAPDLVRWPYPRDATRLAVDLLESWTFRGLLSGSPPPSGNKVTPFWSVETEGAWSGPVFTRRTALRFSARELPRDAAVEVDRFAEYVGRLLDEVAGPVASPP